MRRPQFSLKTLLWLTAVVAAFLGGMFAGSKMQDMRYEFDFGQTVYFNDDGTPAAAGVRTNHAQTEMVPKYPWLDWFPGAPSRLMPSPSATTGAPKR